MILSIYQLASNGNLIFLLKKMSRTIWNILNGQEQGWNTNKNHNEYRSNKANQKFSS